MATCLPVVVDVDEVSEDCVLSREPPLGPVFERSLVPSWLEVPAEELPALLLLVSASNGIVASINTTSCCAVGSD